jgi:hypothetical protein
VSFKRKDSEWRSWVRGDIIFGPKTQKGDDEGVVWMNNKGKQEMALRNFECRCCCCKDADYWERSVNEKARRMLWAGEINAASTQIAHQNGRRLNTQQQNESKHWVEWNPGWREEGSSEDAESSRCESSTQSSTGISMGEGYSREVRVNMADLIQTGQSVSTLPVLTNV